MAFCTKNNQRTSPVWNSFWSTFIQFYTCKHELAVQTKCLVDLVFIIWITGSEQFTWTFLLRVCVCFSTIQQCDVLRMAFKKKKTIFRWIFLFVLREDGHSRKWKPKEVITSVVIFFPLLFMFSISYNHSIYSFALFHSPVCVFFSYFSCPP